MRGCVSVPNHKKELIEYRLSMAKERLHSSKILLDDGSYKDSIGRSYYAMFTSVRALLVVDGIDVSWYDWKLSWMRNHYSKQNHLTQKELVSR